MGHRTKHRRTRRARAEKNRPLSEELQKERANRTPLQQLEHLDFLLGKGIGAKKERARLLEMIASGNINSEAQENK